MTTCQEELNAIPEVAAYQASRAKQTIDLQARPLEGMTLALTINGMLLGKIDPDADEDDRCYTQNTRANFDKLVAALKDNNMPPTVEFASGHEIDLDVQEQWLRNGNLIGNMTFKRRKVKKLAAEEFIEGIARNEEALAPLLKKYPQKRKYFRFPSLKIDRDESKQNQIDAYLARKGYVETPATIDARDGLFTQIYCAALARQDPDCANYIKASFFSVLLDKTLKAREAARQIAGRDVKHILMIRAHQLTCDTLDEMLKWYKGMGVRFISLDEALSDSLYSSEGRKRAAYTVIKYAKRARLLHKGKKK